MREPAGGFTVMDQLDTVWTWYRTEQMSRADAIVQVLAHTVGYSREDAEALLDFAWPPSTPALGRTGVIW